MLLSCPLCCKPHFEGVDSLRITLINVATAPLNCPVCQETLIGLDKLTIHLFGHVNNSGNYCGSAKNEENAIIHVPKLSCENKINVEFDTNLTGQIMATNPEREQKLLVTTQQKNLSEGDCIIACDICRFTFTDRNILEMHQKLLHQTMPDENTGKHSYHCHLCSKKFRMRGSLMVHLRVAHYGFNNHIDALSPNLHNNNESSKKMSQENGSVEVDFVAKSIAKLPECKQWSCDVCAKMFTTKYFLKKHKRLHTGEMPFCCTICNKSFTFQQSYHKHMLYHSSEKPYVCNECGRAFKEHSTLQNHVRIHSGERPFGCEICGKRFRQRVSYLVHTRIHTGVMPYKCTACNKSFRYKVSQRSHKCPINPPGSVIRVSDSNTDNSFLVNLPIINENKPSTQDSDISIAKTPSIKNLKSQHDNNKTTKCIMTVDYDAGKINLIPESVLKSREIYQTNDHHVNPEKSNQNQSTGNCLNEDCLLKEDVYSTVLSPILSEVEALFLNNNYPLSPSPSATDKNIQLIQETCLEELFK